MSLNFDMNDEFIPRNYLQQADNASSSNSELNESHEQELSTD